MGLGNIPSAFRELADEALNDDARVFFDDTAMKAGDPWPNVLRDGG